MNRPLWLDSVYILVWMLPPVLVAFVVSKMTGLSGIVELGVFLGIGLVAVILWLVMLVLWPRLFKSES